MFPLSVSALAELLEEPIKTIRTHWREWTAREASLELWQGNQQQQKVSLGEERCRIGRDPSCEVTVEAPGISRIHCFVERDHLRDRDFTLEDFQSSNGVFWNDRRISAIHLRHGDEVHLGSPLKSHSPWLRYQHSKSKLERLLHWAGLGFMAISGMGISALLLASSISGGSKIREISGPIKIYASNGQQIDLQQGSATALPSLRDYPIHLRQALLASEDERFGWNSGLDVFGTLRAALHSGGGGSGLTQQVARIYYPSVGREAEGWSGMMRKLRELWVAWQLETGFSKNKIIKMYLDRAYLGLGSEGFEQASQLYFRKSARELEVSESAFLVGLLPAPNHYSPCNSKDPSAARERRNLVLNLMHKQGYLTEQKLIDAKRRPLNIDVSACKNSSYSSYPFFADYILGELQGRRFGLNTSDPDLGGNYAVQSTIDPRIQKIAQEQLKAFLEGRAKPVGLTQGALITLEIKSGKILAYVGGGDYGSSSFDRVQAMRQPGSTFKLFTFLAALKAGSEPDDSIACSDLGYVRGCSHGPGSTGTISMANAVTFSENVAAIRMAEKAGYANVIDLARELGISTPLDESYGMVLGGKETYLYEMARAYAAVANGGKAVPMHGVQRIYDLGICQSIYQLSACPSEGVTIPRGEEPLQILSPEVASKMDGMLRSVVSSGTGRAANTIGDARGKTGTTNLGVDVLFIGYSPSAGILTAIWMGNDDNTPAEDATSALAAELWGKFMLAITS